MALAPLRVACGWTCICQTKKNKKRVEPPCPTSCVETDNSPAVWKKTLTSRQTKTMYDPSCIGQPWLECLVEGALGKLKGDHPFSGTHTWCCCSASLCAKFKRVSSKHPPTHTQTHGCAFVREPASFQPPGKPKGKHPIWGSNSLL